MILFSKPHVILINKDDIVFQTTCDISFELILVLYMICVIQFDRYPMIIQTRVKNHPTSNELIQLIEPYIINQYKHLHNPIHTPKHNKMEKNRNPNTQIGGK